MGELSSLRKVDFNRFVFSGIFFRKVYHKICRLPDKLFPPTCSGCSAPVSQVGTLCAACWKTIAFLEQPLCPVMGTPFSYDLGEHFLSAPAIANPPPFRRARAAVMHDGVARRMTISLKYYDRLDLARWMAGWMMRSGALLIKECDIIIPVPLHRRRLWERRYNQAAELARFIAKRASKPYAPTVLIRVKHTRQQTDLSGKERVRNVRGAFQVPDMREVDVRGRAVLLIDDVYTTGATVRAATRALLRAGASSVDVLTFSRTLTKPEKLG